MIMSNSNIRSILGMSTKEISPIRSGNHWSTDEEKKLKNAYEIFINKVAIIHSRSITAMLYRLNNYSFPVKLIEKNTTTVGTNTD